MKIPRSIKGLSQLIYLITTHVLFFSLPVCSDIWPGQVNAGTKKLSWAYNYKCVNWSHNNDNMDKSDYDNGPIGEEQLFFPLPHSHPSPKLLPKNNNIAFLSSKSNTIAYDIIVQNCIRRTLSNTKRGLD